MRRHFHMWLGFVVAASGIGLQVRTSLAADRAEATVNDIFDFGVLGAKGSTSVSAYSSQLAVVNNTIGTNVTLGGAAQNVGNNAPLPFYGTGATAPNIGTLTPVYGLYARYPTRNSYGLNKASLTKIGDQYTITSTTANYNSEGSAYISKAGERNLYALALGGAQMGKAAGRAVDPFSVPSGYVYPYDPTVAGDIEVDYPGDTASINALAMDSYVAPLSDVDNYPDNGAPSSESLWTLSMQATSLTTSASTVAVNFQLNPAALGEITFDPAFLASIGPYSDPTSEAVAIDVANDLLIESQLAEDMDGAAVDLNTVNVMPDDTTYTPAGSGVDYLDETDADVAGVPEPSAAWIGVGLLGFAGLITRPRKRMTV